ncbi:MAG: hypothetical protein HC830_08850 [Bacteroidetes bacterium]|nr:hypothetical protein [Bacteroidales bacterium]NJO69360.1 hypothetical protein [Bacteroidota bacterium]
MNQYVLTGKSQKNRFSDFGEMEDIINMYGAIVAFDSVTSKSLNLRIELSETKVKSLVGRLSKFMSLSEIRHTEGNPRRQCHVLLKLTFQN